MSNMDCFIRINEEQSFKYSNEYSEKYETYNCISSVIDTIESQTGGLYPVEVWSEVIRLEKLLLTAKRKDKFIAEQRTRLENKYRLIIVDSQGGVVIKRSKLEARKSVMCVLLALAMHLESCPDGIPNPHQPIIDRIYKMVVEYDPQLAQTIGEAYNFGEDEENELGYFVPPHDPLKAFEISGDINSEDVSYDRMTNSLPTSEDAKEYEVERKYEHFVEVVNSYDFSECPKVKCLTRKQQGQLIRSIAKRSDAYGAYAIAMLCELEYDIWIKESFSKKNPHAGPITKTAIFKHWTDALGLQNTRAVTANYNLIRNKDCKENQNIYKSREYVQRVKEDYEKIKTS